jgi:hypothetical protein
MEAEPEFVTIIKCRTLPEADLIVSELQGAGIEAFIPDESLMQNMSLPGAFGYVRVQVARKDYEAARGLIDADADDNPVGQAPAEGDITQSTEPPLPPTQPRR